MHLTPSRPPKPPETKPKLVSPLPAVSLQESLEYLELSGGNLKTFLTQYRGVEQPQFESVLFQLYAELAKPENKDLARRWDKAIERSAQIRLKLLQCKALSILENFYNPADKSPSPEVSYCNLVLGDILLARNERAKAKIQLPALQATETPEFDELDKDIAMLTQVDEEEIA